MTDRTPDPSATPEPKFPWTDVKIGDRVVSVFHNDGRFYALSPTNGVIDRKLRIGGKEER